MPALLQVSIGSSAHSVLWHISTPRGRRRAATKFERLWNGANKLAASGEKRPVMRPRSRVARMRAHRPGTPVYELQDLCFFGYVASITTLILVRCAGHCNVDHPWALVSYHLLLCTVGVAAPLLAARWPHPAVRFFRWWYPALLFTFCFEAIGRMIHFIQPTLIDDSLIIAEKHVFGAMLTPLLQAHASPWFTELMYFCYSSYYFLIPVVVLVLYFRSPDRSG